MSKATENPERPFTVVLGGSKVSDKIGIIENLLDKANRLVIGGGMVFTFLKAKGYEVGTSLLEEDQLEKVKGYIETAEKNGVELVLPTDVVVNAGFPAGDTRLLRKSLPPTPSRPTRWVWTSARSPRSSSTTRSSTPRPSCGTARWACSRFLSSPPAPRPWPQGLVDATAAGAFTIVGGGDSASAVRNLGFPEDGFSPHLHRWWRFPRVPRRQGAPGLKVLE